jgi:hypothetical protein
MATFDVALVREQGVSFAILSVADSVINSPTQRNHLIEQGVAWFQLPTVLMGSHSGKLWGRHDLVRFLSRVHPSRLPWRRMSLSA